jgi:hypothetical protein
MNFRINILAIILINIFFIVKDSFSQEKLQASYKKNITLGVSTVISNPYFLNAIPDIGFRMYNNKTNLGFGINSKLMVRFKYDNFIVSITEIIAYKKLKTNRKSPIDLGMGIGFGINSSPASFFLTSLFIGIPVWKLQLECQPTIVFPTIKSSYINLGLTYYLNKRTK